MVREQSQPEIAAAACLFLVDPLNTGFGLRGDSKMSPGRDKNNVEHRLQPNDHSHNPEDVLASKILTHSQSPERLLVEQEKSSLLRMQGIRKDRHG